MGEANPYVWFGYESPEICNHTGGQVSGSMNAYPINIIHTSQKIKKNKLNKQVGEYFKPSILKLQRTILDE